jgi:hypothetical protein
MVWFGTGEARLRSLVSKDRSYMPVVKSVGVRRESDGVVVPVIAMQQNVAGGKGPDFGHIGDEGKREGMTGTARSNHPRKRVRRMIVLGEEILTFIEAAGSLRWRGQNGRWWRPDQYLVGEVRTSPVAGTTVSVCSVPSRQVTERA